MSNRVKGNVLEERRLKNRGVKLLDGLSVRISKSLGVRIGGILECSGPGAKMIKHQGRSKLCGWKVPSTTVVMGAVV